MARRKPVLSEFPEFNNAFGALPDPRKRTTVPHSLINILFMGVVAVLANCRSPIEMAEFCYSKRRWFKKHLDLKNGVPSATTFYRIFTTVDFQAFRDAFRLWSQGLIQETLTDSDNGYGKQLAIDGKNLRSVKDSGLDGTILNIVSAYATDSGLSLVHEPVGAKTNEISGIKEILRILGDLKGAVVTSDAIGCQRDICEDIKKKGGDYLISLKGNQSKLHEDVKDVFSENILPLGNETNSPFFDHETIDIGHGRIEQRTYSVTSEIDELLGHHAWPGLKSVGRVESTRSSGHESPEGQDVSVRYFISSKNLDAQSFASLVRDHWGIESGFHGILDVSFREDYFRTRHRNLACNMRLLTSIAFNLIAVHNHGLERKGRKRLSTQRLRRQMAQDEHVLSNVLRRRSSWMFKRSNKVNLN